MPSIQAITSNPLITNFAVDASQSAVSQINKFLSPLCEVPDLTFRYKKYDAKNRFRRAESRRDVSGRATRLGFTAQDVSAVLNPHALDFPIPNVAGMSEQTLQYSVQEGISVLADASGLDQEAEVIELALAAAGNGAFYDFTSPNVSPIELLDQAILDMAKASRNGAPVKVLFGTNAFKKFRNNKNVTSRYVVGSKDGKVSPTVGDVGGLLISNPEVQMSFMVIDNAPEGIAADVSFILDDTILVFASRDTPNRMDPSFMKTFVPMGGFFRPGSYLSEDERDQVLKMDWTSLPAVTNSAAVARINTVD